MRENQTEKINTMHEKAGQHTMVGNFNFSFSRARACDYPRASKKRAVLIMTKNVIMTQTIKLSNHERPRTVFDHRRKNHYQSQYLRSNGLK